MATAHNLATARKVLDPRPLDFHAVDSGNAAIASNPVFYTPLPEQRDGSVRRPSPIEKLCRQLLTSPPDTKLFLCGHVGSGKSTELNRLTGDKKLTEQFSITTLRFEQQEWATLDSVQLRFRVAAELFRVYKARLARGNKRWEALLKQLSDGIYQQVGITATEGGASLEFDFLVVKLKQELKLSEKARIVFRQFGETQRSVLQDFVQALVDEITESLSREDSQGPTELLLVIDDLDKVRQPEQQKDIFDTNLNALLALPLRLVCTLPTGVFFAENRQDLRHNVHHLFPVRVLTKSPGEADPEKSFIEERLEFFRNLLSHRVAPGVIDDDAVRLAAIHSGGVLREFLRLLREGVNLADYNEQTVLDGVMMKATIDEARRLESVGLYGSDYEALIHVHQTNELSEPGDRRYLDQARIIECYNGEVWFEANPLLWPLLSQHLKRKNAQSPAIPPVPTPGG